MCSKYNDTITDSVVLIFKQGAHIILSPRKEEYLHFDLLTFASQTQIF